MRHAQVIDLQSKASDKVGMTIVSTILMQRTLQLVQSTELLVKAHKKAY